MTASLVDDVKSHIARNSLVLFAGSGVSANLGLPPWGGLIDKMAGDIDFDSAMFKAMGEFPALAEYYEITKGGRSELVDWMRTEWHSSSISTLSSAIHDHIVRCNFPRIYTTNYDHWLERSYSERGLPYERIVDIRDLPKMATNGPRIVKFHGDLDRPDTMILTESDYASRMSLDSELDIQFRSDTFQRGVLFVGYSLSDRNLRYILHKLRQIRSRFSAGPDFPHSYLFTHRVNHVEQALLSQWNIKVIVSSELDPSAALEGFLSSIS